MKIALCGRFNTEKKHQGGSAEVFLALAEGLAKKGHDITLFGRGEPTKEIQGMCKKNKIRFYYIPSDSITNILLGPFRALKLMKKRWDNFDIVHTHTGSFAWASTFFRKKAKIVTHVHEIPQNNPLIAKTYLGLEVMLLKYAAKRSHETITVSKYMKDIIKNKWDIKNVKSIPNGVDLEVFKFKKINKIKNLFNNKNKTILFVGRLTERKGILELLEAFKLLKNEPINLLIIGNGELNRVVKKYLNNKVKLIEFVRNSELPEYYSSVYLTIIPSHYEPFGLVPRESLACGTPALVANNTGLKEVKIAYFLKSLAPKSIAESIDELSKKKLISKKDCRSYIKKNYDWDKIIIKYEQEYKELK